MSKPHRICDRLPESGVRKCLNIQLKQHTAAYTCYRWLCGTSWIVVSKQCFSRKDLLTLWGSHKSHEYPCLCFNIYRQALKYYVQQLKSWYYYFKLLLQNTVNILSKYFEIFEIQHPLKMTGGIFFHTCAVSKPISNKDIAGKWDLMDASTSK